MPIIFLATIYGCNSSQNASNVGILILAPESTNASVLNNINEIARAMAENYPTEVAFGIADHTTIKPALDSLNAADVENIIAVQLFFTSNSPIVRQNEFLLGKRDELADEPILSVHKLMGTWDEEERVKIHDLIFDESMNMKQLSLETNVTVTKALDENPILADILLERIETLSDKPETETVLLVTEMQSEPDDNDKLLESMANLVSLIKAKTEVSAVKFKGMDYFAIDNNLENNSVNDPFRNAVMEAGKSGDVFIIPVMDVNEESDKLNLKMLDGLDFKLSEESILAHPYIGKFVEKTVNDAIKVLK